MAVFIFSNGQKKNVELVIEPWAMSVVIEPEEIVEFEVGGNTPPALEFEVQNHGPFIFVAAETVRIRIRGEDTHFTVTPEHVEMFRWRRAEPD